MITSPEVLPDEETEITEPDGKAHYVRIQHLFKGGPVVALCGKKYIPTVIANAQDRPMCPSCDELMEMLKLLADL